MVEDTAPLNVEGEIPPPNPRQVKLLKIVVTVLGVLLIVGTIVLVTAIIYRASKLKSAPQAKGFNIETVISKESQVISSQLDGDRLAVRIRTRAGEELILYNVKKGLETGRIQLKK